MRKLLVLIAALSLFVGACGGSDSGGGSCESVADEAIGLIQEVIDELDSMSVEALASEEEPAIIGEMEQKSEDLQTAANDLGCSDEKMEELLNARVGDLSADGLFGEFMLAEIQDGGFFGE